MSQRRRTDEIGIIPEPGTQPSLPRPEEVSRERRQVKGEILVDGAPAPAPAPARTRSRTEPRIEAHIFVAFLAYCLQATLKAKLRPLAHGTTPREVIDKFKTMQMVDVLLPTTDGRQLILSRYTQPEPEHRMLLDQLDLQLPGQPPPRITAAAAEAAA